MENGFLPFSRASFTLDFVAVLLTVVLPALTYSWWAVRRRHYEAHRRMQLILGTLLAVVITAFELDIRFNGWRHLAEDSIYYDSLVLPVLVVHLMFALPALVLWVVTIAGALRRFTRPVRPGTYSEQHKRLGRAAAIALYGTAVTGWLFYWLAFVS